MIERLKRAINTLLRTEQLNWDQTIPHPLFMSPHQYLYHQPQKHVALPLLNPQNFCHHNHHQCHSRQRDRMMSCGTSPNRQDVMVVHFCLNYNFFIFIVIHLIQYSVTTMMRYFPFWGRLRALGVVVRGGRERDVEWGAKNCKKNL